MSRFVAIAGAALALTLPLAAVGQATGLEPVPPSIIDSIPRSGSVDVPLSMDSTVRTLHPLTLSGEPGRSYGASLTGIFNGVTLDYEAKLSEVVLKQGGETVGSMFSTSYVASGIQDAASRPVVFMFNGGPGSSAAPLHFAGAWGPKRYKTNREIETSPGETLVDNPHSPLDSMDLVFLDPIDTGFGRSAPGHRDLFRSVDSDSEAVSRFVETWLRENGRTRSPVYLAGESYGTMRVIAMARDLARFDPGIVVAGIIMIGPAPTFGQNGRVPNPIRVAIKAPMFASMAYHYGLIDTRGQTWEQAVEKAREFARREWIPALIAGHDLSQEEFDRVVARMPEVIGIPERHFRENRTLDVPFNQALLADRGLVLDRNNGLQTHPADGPRTPDREFAAVGTRIDDFFRDVLNVDTQALGSYWVSTPRVPEASDWNFQTTGAPALDVTLSRLMKEHADMRFMISQGRHDTLTDLGGSANFIAQTDLPRERVFYNFYDGGHLYANTAEARANLEAFVTHGITDRSRTR